MNIAIWGTGNVGKYIYQQIKDNESYTVCCFVDNNDALWGKTIEGITIISSKQLREDCSKDISFLLVAFLNGISIYEELLDMGLSKFGIIRNRVFEAKLKLEGDLFQDKNIFWSDASYVNGPLLKSLETNIVDYCNLNCKGCSHFSNLFRFEEKVPYDIFCKDLKQITTQVYIYQFNMLGGEVLLADNVIDYIKFARKMLPHSEIQLVSNGLLIPSQTTEFFRCCRENDIFLSITGYKPTLAFKDKIIEKLKDNRIVYSFREEVEEFGKNINLTGMSDKNESMKKCRESKCHFLRYGKIYKCPFEALGNRLFEHYNLNIQIQGGQDIYNPKLDWNKFIKILSDQPVEACRYCGEEQKTKWDVSIKPMLEDWVVEE
ncbi:MAG: hypothetical protein NC489_14315 [Ruminococcus flavefaciens]|nr:hypothetical protein [Ruminococcus flavefaciens]